MSNLNTDIWEGWTAKDFIQELQPQFDMILNGRSWHRGFNSPEEVRKWCNENQPHYKKSVPAVQNHFVSLWESHTKTR